MTSQVSVNGAKKLEGRDVGATLRFDLQLAPPTDDFTNEFSYIHLMKDAEKDSKKVIVTIKEPSMPTDPLVADGDESLAALAKKFEEKYGPKKRKRVLHESDLIDRGSGYDLTDSFVDDSELYENYVPHQLDTKFGGFYVNTGRLEFKPADDFNDSDTDFIVKTPAKKPKVKKLPSFKSTPQAILASQKLKKAKQRAALQKAPPTSGAAGGVKRPESSMVGSPLKLPPSKKQKQSMLAKFAQPPAATTSLTASSIGVGSGVEDTWSDSAGSQPTSASPSLLTGAVVSTATGGERTAVIQTVNLSSKLRKDSSGALKGGVAEGKPQGEEEVVPKEPPSLPINLPTVLFTKVIVLEQLVTKDQDAAGGKLTNKARNSYDERLVDIQQHCHDQGLTKKDRSAIFDYLAYKMGVARGTLVKRMKQEQKKREDTELEKYILELKRAVDVAMPDQIEQYEKEVRARQESMSSQVEHPPAVDAEEESKLEDVFDESTAASGVSVAPSTTTTTNQSTSGTHEKIKRPPIRKRFKWTDEIRKLLCTVVKVKIVYEEAIRAGGKADWEEIIGTFLDNKIKPLWPKGWMQKSVLYKTSEQAHKHLTSSQNKKVVVAKKDKHPVQKKEQPIQPALAQKTNHSHTLTTTSPSLLTSSTTLAPQITSPSILVAPSTSSLPRTLPPIPTKPPAAASIPPHALYASKAGKDKGHLQGKLLKAGNTKMAIPKTTKVATISLGKGNPTTTSSMTTYLLSAGSLNIEQLLQAHLQQKSGGGGGIQLFTTASPSSTSSSSPTSVVLSQAKGAGAIQGVKILPRSSATPRSPDASKPTTAATAALKLKLSGSRPAVATAAQSSSFSSSSSSSSKVTPIVNVPRLSAKVAPPPTTTTTTTVAASTTKMVSVAPQPSLLTRPQSTPPATSTSVPATLSSAQTAALEIGKLESVVSKIVGALGKQQQQQLGLRVSKGDPPSSNPADGGPSTSSTNRLHLTKKSAIYSPKVILPGQGDTPPSQQQGGEGSPRYKSAAGTSVLELAPSSSSSSATTLRAAMSSSALTPIGGTEREVGVVTVSSTTSTPPHLAVAGGPNNTITPPLSTGKFGPPSVTRGHSTPSTKMPPPPPLLVGNTITSPASAATPSPRLPSNSGTGSVSMVPDTPPTFLSTGRTPPPPLSLNHHSAVGSKFNSGLDSEDPCLSPLKSPVEQIMEEHSYLSTSS